VMAYRIVRSPERRVFYIDVGNIPPQDVEQYMQKVMTQMKRNQIVDVNSGRVDLRYNPLSIEEDYYIPVRGAASGTKIDTVDGGKYTGDIDDVKYLRDKLFSALKIPMSYLSRGDGGEEDKGSLAQKDIRFARTIQRLQRSIISELEKIAVVHLFTMGYRGNDLLSFKLALNNPSKLAELQELEHWKARFEAASDASEGYFSRRWVAKNILNLSEEEFQRMQYEMFYDRKHALALEQVGEAVPAGEATGGALGGGEMEGAMGAEEELPETEEAAPEEAGPLLATPGAPPGGEEIPGEAPGKRDEKDKFGRPLTTTSRSKGKWYRPEAVDKRTGRRQSFNAIPGGQYVGRTERSVWPGISMYRGLSEELESNYLEDQEKIVFQESSEVKKLIDSLEENLEKSPDEVQS